MNIHSLCLGVALAVTVSSVHAAGGNVVVHAPQGDASYWTMARAAAARPLAATRTPVLAPRAYGSALLDFTRSRLVPKTNNVVIPYRSIGKLFFTLPDGSDGTCTAAVIRPHLVVTAAHCVAAPGNFFTNFVFVPAFDGTALTPERQRPYGTWTHTTVAVRSSWFGSDGVLPRNDDFGIVVLAEQDFGSGPVSVATKVGRLNLAYDHLADTHVTIFGYSSNLDGGDLLQRVDSGDHRPASSDPNNAVYEYGGDLQAGAGGGPWIENFGSGPAAGEWSLRNAVVGVTSYGFADGTTLALGAASFGADFKSLLDFSCQLAPGGHC